MIRTISKILSSTLALLLIATQLSFSLFLSTTQVSAESAEDNTSGLLGWWQMNHTSGYDALDSSSNGLNGVVQSLRSDSSLWVSGDTPTCDANNTRTLSLDGPADESGEYVSFDAPNPQPSSLTLSAWVKISETEPLSNDYMPIAGNLIHSEGDFGFGLEIDHVNNKIYFINNKNFGGDHTANSPVYAYNESETVNKWVHVAGTYDFDTGDSNLYINGVLKDSFDGDAEETIYYDSGSFSIGRDSNSSHFYKGQIDDVRLYDRALNQIEITELASTGCSASTDDNDGITQITEDSAPNSGDANNDGTKDSEQPKVTSLLSPASNKYVVLESKNCTTNTSVSINKETGVATQDDDNYQYPFGFINFSLTGCAVGSTETITQYYYGEYDPAKLVLRKYNNTTHEYTTITGATITSVTVAGQKAVKVVYQVTDGGTLDQDGSANGTIVDPAGLGQLEVTAPNTGLKKENMFIPVVLFSTAIVMFILAKVRRV